ncbi:MAG TPA: PIN domain nuclease [Oceanospirillaceae bacterium]|nr:PIN domain nuclease [Oceanospirillaceae bacterium]
MNIIIDTHIYLWALTCPERLSKSFRYELESPANVIWLSSVSITEMMIKSSIGKLTLDFDPILLAQQSGFLLLDYSAEDAVPLKSLAYHHKDPFDRMLISQSISRSYKIMTADSKFALYDCKLVR